jgi:hypothetical protein
MKLPTLPYLRAALAAAIATLPLLASATTYTFTQTGYEDGAFISGSFTGSDLDHDGQINSAFGEISNFTMYFSGNSIMPAFSHDPAETFDVVYTVGSHTLGTWGGKDKEGIMSNWGNPTGFDFATGMGPTGDKGGRIIHHDDLTVTFSDELVQVSAVPEPSTAAMTLAGLGLLGLVAARRRRG